MTRVLVALFSIALVDRVFGFNSLPVAPVPGAPRVQPRTASNGATPVMQTISGRRSPVSLPTPAGPSGSSFLPPILSADPALSATQQGQETVPMVAQEAEQADGRSWYWGFAAGIFAGFSAAFLALRSRLKSSAAPQANRLLLELGEREPVYTASPQLRESFPGTLVANFTPPSTVLGGGAPLGRASCTPLRMSMADKFSSRRQLLQGATLAAAGNILPAFAEGGNSAPAPGELGYEGTTEAGVKFKILETTTALGDKVGIVETAKKGDFVILSVKATSADGKVLMDTSVDGKGFAVTLGKGKTILGLEDGVTGMKAGERRRLQIPAGELTDPIKQDVDVEVTFERKSGLMKFFSGN